MNEVNTVWISDLHLLSSKTEVDLLHNFLKELKRAKPKRVYLVGDIIDLWAIIHGGVISANLGQKHMNIIQQILKLAKNGTDVVYVVGNHDILIEEFIPNLGSLGNVRFVEREVYTTLTGLRMMVMHGHQFDLITKYHPFVVAMGDHGYEWLIWINKWYNRARALLGFEYWSLSKYIKGKVKTATQYISDYSSSLVHYTKEQNCSLVCCGHIHEACDKVIDGVRYLNSGCWTDKTNCNAVVEYLDGRIEVINYQQTSKEV